MIPAGPDKSRWRSGVDAATSSLPVGTLPVAIGVLIAGVCAYGFLLLPAATDRLSAEDYAGVSALWFLVFTAVPGVYVPLEQEAARAISQRRVQQVGARPIATQIFFVTSMIAALLSTIAVVALTPLRDELLGGDGLLVVGLILALFTFVPMFVLRGVLSSLGQFADYGRLIALDGAIRTALAGALVIAGTSTPGPYGLAIGVAPVASAFIIFKTSKPHLEPGPPRPWSDLGHAVGVLIAAQLFAAMLINAVPLAVSALATDAQRAEAGRLTATFVLARIPLFMFQAVQAALVPRLAAMVAMDDEEGYRSAMVRLLAALVVVVVVAVAAASLVGRQLVGLLFGEEFEIPSRDVALLAAGSGVLMIAIALSQALLAAARYQRMLVGWVLGVVVFAVVAMLGNDLFLRVEVAFLAAAFVSAVSYAPAVLGRSAAWVTTETQTRS